MTDRGDAPQERRKTFGSLAALRKAHTELMPKHTALMRKKSGIGSDSLDTIKRFLDRAVATGTCIRDDDERHRAQSIIDYWTAELVSASEDFDSNSKPAVLADFVETRDADTDLSQSSETQLKTRRGEESRELVRLAAIARQWRDWQQPGLLLSGEALKQAAQLRDFDEDLEKFVKASEEQEAAWRNKKSWIIWSGALTACTMLLVLSVGAFMHFAGFPSLSEREVRWIKDPLANTASQQTAFRWLAFYQLWMAPDKSNFDLSSASVRGTKLSKLRLYVPNFSLTKIIDADFEAAIFPYASFSDSRLLNVNFKGATLPFAQFREARIVSASFADANLYRATFDRACLHDVNFSGADLRAASFWGTTLDTKFERHFTNTAWWLAVGWNSIEIEKLIPLVSVGNPALKKSASFQADAKRIRDGFDGTRAGTFGRALALNSMAWTLATWGVDISDTTDTKNESAKEGRCSSRVLQSTAMPASALEAAEQAVCIVENLNQIAESVGRYATELASFRDTLAYVLMQIPGRMADAAQMYENDVTPVLKGNGEVQFRSAVALYATGKDSALKVLTESIQNQYLPSHELQNLRAHITGNFRTRLYTHIDAFWPTLPERADCRVAAAPRVN
jgi:Pentapeptide repeats (9 copies)